MARRARRVFQPEGGLPHVYDGLTPELRNLIKAAALFSVAPLLFFIVLSLSGRLSITETALYALLSFSSCALAARPVLRDLRALKEYVADLAEGKQAECPPLLMLGNVEMLPDAVRKLHETWHRRASKLETTLRKNYVIFHSLPAPVLVLSAEHIVLDTNRSARTLFKTELLGKKLEDLILDQRLHNACARLQGYEEQVAQAEVDIGSARRHFECVLHPLTPKEIAEQGHARPTYASESIVCLLYDVSNIVKAQEAMRDFVANASHEIQTPLTGIVGFIEAMLEEDFPRDSEYYAKFLKICLDRSYALSALARDLLSLAKIEMSTHDVFADKVDLAALALAAADQYRYDSSLLQKGMRLKTAVERDVPEFYGNATELQLLVSNLLSNAVKYGAEGGEIELIVRVYRDDDAMLQRLLLKKGTETKVHYAERYVSLAVRNDGELIPEEKIPRLVERFYRADASRGDGAGGSGIGLSIVQRIVDHHAGMLEVVSAEEEGNVFRAYFPAAPAPSYGRKDGGSVAAYG
jgi:two-component system phosphate regulon sensor histidine kinase PhoR